MSNSINNRLKTLDVGSGLLFTDANNNRVGVGTSVPESALNINGGVGDITTGITLGDGDTGFYEFVDDSVSVRSGGVLSWTFDSTGLRGSGSASYLLSSSSTSSTVPTLIPNKDYATTGLGSRDANQISLIANGSEAINIDSTGNVSIGYRASDSTLEVAGTFSVWPAKTTTSSYDMGDSSIKFTTLLLDAENNNVTATLPTTVAGRVYNILREDEVESGNIATLQPPASGNISGYTSGIDLEQYEAMIVQSTGGGAWEVLASHASSHTIFISAGSLLSSTTSGCADPIQIEFASNGVDIAVADFDPSIIESAQASFMMPNNWSGGPIKVKFIWTANDTTTNSVVWGIHGRSLADGEAIDQALGAIQNVTDANAGVANQIRKTEYTSDVTLAGTPAPGENIQLKIYRLATNTSDTLTTDARLLGVSIKYKIFKPNS